MKTVLFTNARNEKNIVEWTAHHLNLGFDLICILDHNSDIPIITLFKNKPNNVIIQKTTNDILKLNLMYEAHAFALQINMDWMLYLDADEFLVLNNDDTIHTFLEKYKNYDQIGINWLIFGSNNKNEFLTENETILETYTKSNHTQDKHIKSFLNLKMKRIRLANPHVYILDNMKKSINVNFSELDKTEPWWFETKDSFNTSPAYIAHYQFQSYNTYIERKIKLPRDDTRTFRDIIEKPTFHQLDNDINNNSVCDKYNVKNKLLMNVINRNIEILYGTVDFTINVTLICLQKCIYNNIICIPKSDGARARLFTDPLFGRLKSIFIKNILTGNLDEFKDDNTIYVDLFENRAYTLAGFQKPTDILEKIHKNVNIDFGNMGLEYQEQLMTCIFLTGNEKILEIGSNIGRNTLVIASILNSKNNSDFVTLESDTDIYGQLIHNKKLNNLSFFAENSALSKRKLIQRGWDTIPSDEVLPGYHSVNIIDYYGLISKYGIQFDTLVLDCEGAFYYILLDMPEILNNINLILMENDYYNADHKIYVDSVLKEKNFNVIYLVDGCGGWGFCEHNFWEVWLKST